MYPNSTWRPHQRRSGPFPLIPDLPRRSEKIVFSPIVVSVDLGLSHLVYGSGDNKGGGKRV